MAVQNRSFSGMSVEVVSEVPDGDALGMADSTSTSTPTPSTITLTEPVTRTNWVVVRGLKDNALVIPYGTDANDETFDLYVWATKTLNSDAAAPSYYNAFILFLTCTMAGVGAASCGIDENHRVIDTFSAPNANNTTNYRAVNGLNNEGGHLIIGGLGPFDYLQVGFDVGTAAAMNAFAMTY